MASRTVDILAGLFRIVRPHQWSKNLFVLAPLVFSKELASAAHVLNGVLAALLFCCASGAVYALNDVVDAPRDRNHPEKASRPVASGRLPVEIASAFAVFLAGAAIAGAMRFGGRFAAVLLGYLVLNIVYSFWLKKVVVVDVLSIACGFLLRVIAGSFAVRVPASVWILACTFLLSLFLALGKRRHELLLSDDSGAARPVLRFYSPGLINVLMGVVAALSILAYAAYTQAPHTRLLFGTRWLLVTVPFVVFGLLRFMRIAVRKEIHESPTDAIVHDAPFLVNALLWFSAVTAIIYII